MYKKHQYAVCVHMSKYRNDMYSWLYDNLEQDTFSWEGKPDNIQFVFLNKDDAMLFALIWLGE